MLNNKLAENSPNSESGSTLIETIIAILILTIGLMAALATVTFALQMNQRSRASTEAKLMMSSMLEQVETLRNTGQLTFKQIANTNDVVNPTTGTQFTGFPTTFLPITTNPGPDGIFGTVDDVAGSVLPTQIGYSRRVIVTAISPSLKKIEVTVQSSGSGGKLQNTVMNSYINDNGRSNQK